MNLVLYSHILEIFLLEYFLKLFTVFKKLSEKDYLFCCYARSRNQKQTGIRQNRKRLFKAKVRSQVIRICKGTESQGRIVIVSRSVKS